MKSSCNNDVHGGNPSAVAKKLGLDETPEIKFDFSVNINPMGMPEAVRKFVLGANSDLLSDYPEIHAGSAVSALAKAHGVPVKSVIVGNGSTELFSMVLQSLKPAKIAWIAPNYSGYSEICAAHSIPAAPAAFAVPEKNFKIELSSLSSSDAKLFFLCSPNNPTGSVIGKDKILSLASAKKNKYFIIDESFMDFLPDSEEKSLFSEKLPDNLLVVKSLTKFFSIAGIRLGMLYASPSTAAKVAKTRLPWSVNAIAQGIAPLLYANKEYICESRMKVCEFRKSFSKALSELPGLKVYPSQANFLLCEIRNKKFTADKLQAELLKRGILIRSCSNWNGLGPNFFRLAVLNHDANNFLISNLKNILIKDSSNIHNSSFIIHPSPVMVVGTSSGSGKSLLVAALCRYFLRKGLSVAPFKAQNMSLNSFVTPEGGEIGRAQAMQARAAKIPPHTDMNPVLLKPTGEAGSQLIVNGKPLCNVTARSYYEEKCEIRKEAFKAFDRLSSKHDIVILEGAGSPAEINLLDKDFVNMAMAEYARARTILVADIDKGGVFASIFGTIKLVPERFKKLFSGVIINKFRGDVSLLKPGIDEIEKLTGVPVLGVLPFIKDLRIEEEDSLGLETRKKRTEDRGQKPDSRNKLEIAVIRLPRISNYTDFLVFEKFRNINISYVENKDDLGEPDLIFIPGTKNTRADMAFLHESGLSEKILDAHTKGIPVFGICGGYQILGKSISDPHGIEDKPGTTKGLSLLPIETVIEKTKELAQVKGRTSAAVPFCKTGTHFEGYEIHMGKTKLSSVSKSAKFAILDIEERHGKKCRASDGAVSLDGLVFGTYVHGIFDSPAMHESLIKWLCGRKGIKAAHILSETRETEDDVFEKLADLVGKHIDLRDIERIQKLE